MRNSISTPFYNHITFKKYIMSKFEKITLTILFISSLAAFALCECLINLTVELRYKNYINSQLLSNQTKKTL